MKLSVLSKQSVLSIGDGICGKLRFDMISFCSSLSDNKKLLRKAYKKCANLSTMENSLCKRAFLRGFAGENNAIFKKNTCDSCNKLLLSTNGRIRKSIMLSIERTFFKGKNSIGKYALLKASQ